jgi:hypothetical protein
MLEIITVSKSNLKSYNSVHWFLLDMNSE